MKTSTSKKVVAVNDERDACECCGRSGLKRVVWIEVGGEIRHFGTTCATRSMPALFGEIKAAVKEYESKQKDMERALRRESAQRLLAEAMEIYRKRGGTWKTVQIFKGTGDVPADPELMKECRMLARGLFKAP